MSDDQEKTAPLELESLQAGWAAKENLVPVCEVALDFAGKTDLGRVRENNEDKWEFFEPDTAPLLAAKGRVFAVADGMGGHAAGQIAAELALNTFIRQYYAHASDDVEASLQHAVREANRYVVDVARTVPGRSGMGATLTAVVIRDDDLYIAQVGDSRCYLLRGDAFEQLTEDHSWVAEQVAAGNLTLEEAESSPLRNVITRSMGGAPEVEADLSAIKLAEGDRYLLCSDGLSGMVPTQELKQVLAEAAPSAAVWKLIERANHYGGKDNITALVIEVVKILPWRAAAAADAPAQAAENNGHHPEIEPSAAVAAAEPSAPEPAEVASDGAEPDLPQDLPEKPGQGGLMTRLFGRR